MDADLDLDTKGNNRNTIRENMWWHNIVDKYKAGI